MTRAEAFNWLSEARIALGLPIDDFWSDVATALLTGDSLEPVKRKLRCGRLAGECMSVGFRALLPRTRRLVLVAQKLAQRAA